MYRILKSIVFLVHSYYLYFITYGKFQIHTESKWYNETSMYSSASINNYQFMAVFDLIRLIILKQIQDVVLYITISLAQFCLLYFGMVNTLC